MNNHYSREGSVTVDVRDVRGTVWITKYLVAILEWYYCSAVLVSRRFGRFNNV